MKTKILILLTFACIKLSYGQTYYPLVDSNYKEWKVFLYDLTASQSEFFAIMHVKSDTTIIFNSNTYKKYISYFYVHSTHGWGQMTTNVNYLREDSTKKVYRYGDFNCVNDCNLDSNYEYLFYDFSLNINDIFVSTYCMSCGLGSVTPASFNWKVINIDSVLVGNSMRKRFFLQEIGYSNTDIWIEGIGSIFGLFNPSWPHITVYRYELTCFNENENLLFINPNTSIDSSTFAYFSDSCLTPLGMPYQHADNSQIYISNKVLYINTASSKTGTICLYNTLGRCLLIQQVQGNTQIDLQSKGINDELLFYRMTDEKRILKTGKLCL